MPLKVQYVSDVHLERNPDVDFETVLDVTSRADVLILAGDIGCPRDPRYKTFLQECSSNFRITILVPGNHEYLSCYPQRMCDTDRLLSELCVQCSSEKNKIFFLSCGHGCVIGDVHFIGATLWSHFPEAVDPRFADMINTKYFRGLEITPGNPLTVTSYNALFLQHLSAIDKCVKWGLDHRKKNFVITHHAPTMQAFRVKDLPKDHLYGTELSGQLCFDDIAFWIYGHTHWNTLLNFQGTTVTSNQFGGKAGLKGWRDCATIIV